ncbi:hypothetical protein ZIOFF_040838 [Zingiber officinale]|uniref:Uncharacterized protein n=1 Tax=Zingiber officinale TaxID=94328 RepID=A0A8J5G3W9_ZINOF|nr:hypothetical protein ZIOFF_040838 [Zingiber officinale]
MRNEVEMSMAEPTLAQGPTSVVAKIAANNPKCQDVFTLATSFTSSLPSRLQDRRRAQKTMATKGNTDIRKSIIESRALLCFAVLLKKGTRDVQYNSAMALMEIVCTAKHNDDLRRSAFKPNSPASNAIIEQFLQIVVKGEFADLLIASVTALGYLSRTFRATEKRIIGPLVRLLDDKAMVVLREVVVALTKFACTENYLHVSHSQAIIDSNEPVETPCPASLPRRVGVA